MNVALVIPCYNVGKTILDVLDSVPRCISRIYIVDDKCPLGTGKLVDELNDSRITVILNEKNFGVGGATIIGFRQAFKEGHLACFKADGDGQMDLSYLPKLISILFDTKCDFVKGNRFTSIENLKLMPKLRIFGNAVLSFLTKITTGYWILSDPTNGYIGLTRETFYKLSLQKIDRRYFFESDLIFQLSLLDSIIAEYEMPSIYGNEVSGIKVRSVVAPFLLKHSKNFLSRFFYVYVARGFSIGTFALPLGLTSLILGIILGTNAWTEAVQSSISAPTGTIVLSAVLILFGIQSATLYFIDDLKFSNRSFVIRNK